MDDRLLLLQLIATAAMTGVIWLVQLVVYPAFGRVSATDFKVYHQAHIRQISWVVLPLMLVEMGSAVYLAIRQPQAVHLLSLLLLAAIWLSTFLLQVPQHRRISEDHDPALIRRLVRGNWIRTCLWSVRLLLLAWLAWPT